MKLMRIVALSFVLFMAAIMFTSSGSLPQIYDPYSAPAVHITDHYIEKAVEETGTANMVTAVLADYRGYDTLGEKPVIFTAGLAAVLLLRASRKPAVGSVKLARQKRG